MTEPWWLTQANETRRSVMIRPFRGIAAPFGMPTGYQWSVSHDVLDEMRQWVKAQWGTDWNTRLVVHDTLFGVPVVEVEAPPKTMLLEPSGTDSSVPR